MKIAWFTPFSTKSAIGYYSKTAAEHLSKYCEVDLFLFEKENIIDTSLKKYFFTKDDRLQETLSAYDFIVYNLGNYPPFHLDIYEVSRKVKGIVILHDFVMHHFFLGYYLNYKKNKQEYRQEFLSLYGPEALKYVDDSFSGKIKPIWESEQIIQFPFFEKAIEGAQAVITHSHFHREKVLERYPGKVKTLYFPFDKQSIPAPELDASPPASKLLLLTFGDVNPNKRIHQVLKVIGMNNTIKEKVEYVIIGSLNHRPYVGQLNRLLQKYRLGNIVTLLGYQDDSVLLYYIKKADIFINLRYPAIEGASDSLLKQLTAGKPSLVTDTGFYSELPSDVVVKIEIKQEMKNIEKALRFLIQHHHIRKEIGLKAMNFAEQKFNPDEYCRGFLELLTSLRK
ncbi:glycosyltransferase family 4 protein [Neobacillus muris]|uniref:glycosyltransferase family 4 protein n=1 Tax=Neobacillus muris TaxID=2941334 RepID=UPI00203CAD0C|nr:glycosyltransferase [Neobacillus muris]